ncbi:MAG: hypothetical protein AABX48_01890 [Nanoarchaeota archaeon]
MDCCENTKQDTEQRNKTENMKGGKNMVEINKNIFLWIVIGVLFLSVLFLTYKASTLTGNVAAGDSGKLDTTGWTDNEIMNYEMHGTVPARAQGSASSTSAGSGMVGGC